ncbi:MAG: flagellar hook-basal body complex protein [Syntrophomonas sp.]|nr:flagellar hook-basal body complex protein [Syntrophomonas sp.]
MMRSLYSGVSGLRNHQTRMDVVGNNIANVNTAGFKKSRVVFKDTLYQIVRGASSPVEGTQGGTNPMGIGLGMSVSSIDQIHTGAPTTTTNKLTDMAVDGNGYFIVNNGGQRYYTRAGAFDFDVQGSLISLSNGYFVQGWNADPTTYALDTTNDPTNINIAGYKQLDARTTTEVILSGNLDSDTPFTASRNEWQTLTFDPAVNPIGGNIGDTFNLTLDGNTTADIAVAGVGVPSGADTATAIQTALEALPNVGTGNVTVTWDAVRQRYDIKFQGNLAKRDISSIVYNNAAPLTANPGMMATLYEGQAPLSAVPVNEVQTLTVGGAALSTFQLTYGASTTAAIPVAASATDIQQALELADGSLLGNVLVSDGAVAGTFDIKFYNGLKGTDIPQMGVTNAAGCTTSIATATQGKPAENPAAANVKTFSKDVYDSLGNKVPVNFRFFKYEVEPGTDPGVLPVVQPVTRWACDISVSPLFDQQIPYDPSADLRAIDLNNVTAAPAAGTERMTRVYNIEFDENGAIINPAPGTSPLSIDFQLPDPSGAANSLITMDFHKLSQIAAESSAWAESQDGYGAGKLTSYSIGVDGIITGVYDNGQKKGLAQVALRNFENPGGLQQLGGTLFMDTVNSGALPIGTPGANGLGKIAPGSLEMSNVDLSEEFTDMIITQRGFQANSRIITTSDEMLQELVNLKR